MASPIRIKRRAGGSPGAPTSLLNAELAFNEVDNILYYGKGSGGAGGTASTIIPIGGPGAFVDLSSSQTVGGTKTFSSIPKSTGTPSAATDLATVSWVQAQIGSAGGGTVTSVGVTVPTGFSVSGSPVTDSGTIIISYAAGYIGYTTTEATKLAGIETGAQVNVKPNWSSAAGTASEILNKPMLGILAAKDKISVPGDITATGTASATTYLRGDGSWATPPAGTVTSVGISVPTGLSVSNTPVTSSGTIALTWTTGYVGYTTAEATKLSGIAAGATANNTDAYLLSRTNHTGAQAISTITNLQTTLDGKIASTEKGATNGVATLDGSGKLTSSQIPDSLLGSLSYKGTWNASTNTPTIPAAAAGNKGYYYVVNVAGSSSVSGITDWKIGDWIVSNGTAWEKIDNTDQVTSVAGKQGVVTLVVADITDAGSMALQNANSVAITGGTIDNVTIDGGTF